MATPRWVGGAAPVAQVNTFAFAGTWEADDLIRVISGQKQKDLTAGSATTNTVVSNTDTNIDALSSTTYPEITSDESGVTATSATSTLTLTANEPGVPFTISLTPLEANGGAADAQTIEGAGTVTTGTAATANQGPSVWSTTQNWSTGAAPTTGDTLYIDNTDDDILYNLSQAGATVAAAYIAQNFEGTIGLPKTNELGTEYPEYRTDYLTLDCSAWHIGQGPGNGSGRIKINSGTVQTAVTVYNSGSPLESNLKALIWKGTHASNTLTAQGNASVDVAPFGGEVATIATLSIEEGADVRCGPGVTLTTVTVRGGTVELNSAVTTLTILGGRVVVNGTGAVTTLIMRGGECVYNTSGTLGTASLGGDSVLDFSQDPRTKTVTNPIDLYGTSCRVIDGKKVVTGGSGLIVDGNEGTTSDQVDWGVNCRWTRGTPA